MRLVRAKKEEAPPRPRSIRTIKISSSPEPLPPVAAREEEKPQSIRPSLSHQPVILFHDSSSDDDGFDSPEDEESILDDGSEEYMASENEAFDDESDSEAESLARALSEDAMSEDEVQQAEEDELNSDEEAEIHLEPAVPTGVSVGEPVVNDGTPAINRLPLDLKNLILSHLDEDPYSLLQMFTVSRTWYRALAYGVQSEVRWRQRIFDLGGQKKSPGCKTWRASWLSRMHRRCMGCFKITSAKFGIVWPGAPLWAKVCEICQFEVERFRCVNAKTAKQLGSSVEDLAELPSKAKHVRRQFRRKGERKWEKEYFRASIVKLVEARAAEQARRYEGMVQRFTGDQQKLWQIIRDGHNGKYAASTKSRALVSDLFNAPGAAGAGFQAKCSAFVRFHMAIDEILVNTPAMLRAHGMNKGLPLQNRRTYGDKASWLDCLADGSAQLGQYLQASLNKKRREDQSRVEKIRKMQEKASKTCSTTQKVARPTKAESKARLAAKRAAKAQAKSERRKQRERDGRFCSSPRCSAIPAANCAQHRCSAHCPGPCARHKSNVSRTNPPTVTRDAACPPTKKRPVNNLAITSGKTAPVSNRTDVNRRPSITADVKTRRDRPFKTVVEPPVASGSGINRSNSANATGSKIEKERSEHAPSDQLRNDISDEQLLALLQQRTHLAASLPENVAKRVVETVKWDPLQQWRQERIKVKKEAGAAAPPDDKVVLVSNKKGKGKARAKDEPDKENRPTSGLGSEFAVSRSGDVFLPASSTPRPSETATPNVRKRPGAKQDSVKREREPDDQNPIAKVDVDPISQNAPKCGGSTIAVKKEEAEMERIVWPRTEAVQEPVKPTLENDKHHEKRKAEGPATERKHRRIKQEDD